MDDFTDYEEYARSFPNNESLVSMPEGENHDSIGPFDQAWTRDPSPIRYRLSAKPPAQSNIAKQSPASNPVIAKSTDNNVRPHGADDEDSGPQTVQNAAPSGQRVDLHSTSALKPTTQTQTPIPLDRNHPNAATIPGLTPGRDRCDTCFKHHRRCDHAPNGDIDPVLAARPRNRRGVGS